MTAGIQEAARHLAERRAREAAEVLEQIVADLPAYVTAYVLLAKAYEAEDRLADALGAWHRAYFLMPSSPLIQRERARLLTAVPAPADATNGTEERAAAVRPGGDLPEAERPGRPAEAAPAGSIEMEEPPAETEGDGAPDAVAAPAAVPPPTEGLPASDAAEEPDDLDTLIHQLENAPRIRPDPDFDDEGDAADDEGEEVVSETLARIYEAQQQYGAAAQAYEQLASLQPGRATELLAKAAEMRRRAGVERE